MAACVLGGAVIYWGTNAFLNYKDPVVNYFKKKPAPVVVAAPEPAQAVVVAKAQTDVEEEPQPGQPLVAL